MINWDEYEPPTRGQGGDGSQGNPNGNPDHSCPEGKTWMTTGPNGEGYCADTNAGGQQSCPTGTTWNAAEGRCIADDCPSGTTWNSMLGRCVELCPDGQARNGQGQCVDLNMPSGGGNPAPSSGGGGGGSAPTGPANSGLGDEWDSSALNAKYGQIFSDLIGDTGKLSPRWNADNVALVKGNLKASTANEAKRQKDALIARRSAMGTLENPSADRALQGIDRTQGGQYSTGATGIDVTAVGENFNDQLAILDQRREAIQTQASWLLGLANNDGERASIRNSLAVALAQLKQQKEALDKQLAMQKYLAQLGLAGNLYWSST